MKIIVPVVGALALTGNAAAAQYQSGARPHTEVRLEDRSLAIADFKAAAFPRAGGRVLVHMLVSARSRAGTQPRVIRIARCTGSPLAVPNCRVMRSLPVAFNAHTTTIAHLNATMALPPRSVDAVRIEIDPVGKRVQPRTAPFVADAQILLGGRAWRNRAGQLFGARISRPWESENQSFDVRSLDMAATGLSARRLIARMALTGVATSPLTLTTHEFPCPSVTGPCTDPQRIQNTSAVPGTATAVLQTPVLDLAAGADGNDSHTFVFNAIAAGEFVANVNLPWTR
jgi:hypothetical protein